MSVPGRDAVERPVLPAGLTPTTPEAVADADELSGVLLESGRVETRGRPLGLRASAAQSTMLTGARLSALADVSLERCDCANADWSGARARRVLIRDCRCTGLGLAGASLVDVIFERCKLDLACLIEAELTRVWFDACDLREADFDGAVLGGVAFRGCDMGGTRLVRTGLDRVDLRGSRLDDLVVTPDLVRGCVIDPTQAPTFAAALGLDVRALEEGPPRL